MYCKYLLVAILLLWSGALGASRVCGQSDVSGHYEGAARSQARGTLSLKVEIVAQDGKVLGVIKTLLGDIPITGGSYAEGKLSLDFDVQGDAGLISGTLNNGVLTGQFTMFGDSGPIELKRTGPTNYILPVETPANLDLTVEQWREDLRFFAPELPARHKNAFHLVSRAQFEQAVADLDARLPKLAANQIVVGFQGLTAMIGDGHTSFDWPREYGRVPLTLFWFGKELRVTRTTEAYRRILGTRVVAIGGVPVEEVYRRDLAYISQGESPGAVLHSSAGNLVYPAHLHALGVAPNINRATFIFADDKGRRSTQELTALAPGPSPAWIYPFPELPLYLQNPDEPLLYKYLADSQTVWLQFRSYPSRSVFSRFAQDFFAFVDKTPVRRLIVDMRLNGGGDFTKGRDFLISEIKKRPALSQRGKLFVVIGRVTFSAGMTNAADFRNETDAILVGEPTGARPNGYQENRGFSLPNSHLGVSYSTQLYKFQEKDTPGIIPDKLILPSWPAYKAGRDLVLKWILAQK